MITVQPCRVMRDVGKNLGIPLHVFGPETHMTAIVGMALGKRSIPAQVAGADQSTTANFLLPSSVSCNDDAAHEPIKMMFISFVSNKEVHVVTPAILANAKGIKISCLI